MAYEQQIAKGVAFLDEKVPGWLDRIDIGRLDLRTGMYCVLGQLHDGDADGGAHALGLGRSAISTEAVAHGFDDGGACVAPPTRPLTEEWKAALRKLRAERGASHAR
jgi:hypothetical protein